MKDCGFPNIWESELFPNVEYLKAIVKKRLTDQFIQNWNASLNILKKHLTIKNFRNKFEFENYFNLLSKADAISLCRFRTTNHYLPIESVRWGNVERENRLCNFCNKLGDEYHFILECHLLQIQRRTYIDNSYTKRLSTF